MKKLMVPLFIVWAAAAFASSAYAAEGKTMTPQQEKFTNCAHQSKGMKGEEHKKFMRDCLHGKSSTSNVKTEEHKTKSEEKLAAGKTVTSSDKMKTCNSQAKEKQLKGKDRKDFMSECLKGG